MNDLPSPTGTSGTTQVFSSDQSVTLPPAQPGQPLPTVPQPSGMTAPGGIRGKEAERIPGPVMELPLTPVGQEVELPKEVSSVGVKVQPTAVQVPQQVANVGVQVIDPNAPVQPTQTVLLPLTDAEIAQGLKQSVSSSWRWLAEWCKRKLKQLHMRVTARAVN